tara:strand:+ start:1645 stop:2025 length:381 start_codon:yes stop_codon:yes gene_type:complete
MLGSIRPRILESRVDENKREKRVPTSLSSKKVESNTIVKQLVNIKQRVIDQNNAPLTSNTRPITDKRKDEVGENRVPIKSIETIDTIADSTCTSNLCLDPISTFLLKQGIPTIRPSFGLNRYAGFK